MLRRQFLAAPLALRAAARRSNVRLGILSKTYQAHPMAEAARLIRAAGFDGVQIGMRFKDARLDLAAPDWSYARRARDVFGEAGLRIVAVDGYSNIVHPDPEVRKNVVRDLTRLLEHVQEFGTNVVATETGRFHVTDLRHPQPDNPKEGRRQFLGTMRELLKAAQSSGATLAIEPSAITYIGTVESVRAMLHDLQSPHLKILWDPSNYFDEAHIGQMKPLFQKMYATFASKIVLAHAKDVRLKPDGTVEWVAAGRGEMDYTTYASLLHKLDREMFLCLEYAKEPEVADVKGYIEKYL